jgi:hypothetical protein
MGGGIMIKETLEQIDKLDEFQTAFLVNELLVELKDADPATLDVWYHTLSAEALEVIRPWLHRYDRLTFPFVRKEAS